MTIPTFLPQLPQLPDQNCPDFMQKLIDFGRFLEKHVRPGCAYDLSNWPNQLWRLIETRMLAGLEKFIAAEVPSEGVLMLQWYNSGAFIKASGRVLAFDIVPIPRYYGWPEPDGLTDRIARFVDTLFVTHNHQDHYDVALVEACLGLKKTVCMHPDAAPADLPVARQQNGEKTQEHGFSIISTHACHVWRRNLEEVPLVYFDISCPDGFRFIFCGDADYTRGFVPAAVSPDVLFITWRNPGPLYEDGHPEQIGNTFDAVKIAIDELLPRRLVLQHYGELDHIYRGFTASYDLAADLISKLPVPTSIFFWGDIVLLRGNRL